MFKNGPIQTHVFFFLFNTYLTEQTTTGLSGIQTMIVGVGRRQVGKLTTYHLNLTYHLPGEDRHRGRRSNQSRTSSSLRRNRCSSKLEETFVKCTRDVGKVKLWKLTPLESVMKL